MEPENRTTVISLLDHIEHLVAAGKRVPFMSGVLVNEEEILEIIDRARMSFPDDLVRAHQVVKDRDQMLTAAEAQGEKMMAQARQQAEQLMTRAENEAELLVRHAQERADTLSSDHAIVQAAQRHAADTLATADERAQTVQSEADQYARDIMERLEDQLVRTLTTVRKGVDTLPPAPKKRRPSARE